MNATWNELAKPMPAGLADYYNRSASKDAPEFFPYIKIVAEEVKTPGEDDKTIYQWVMKLPGEKELYKLGETIKGKILATYICYNHYDVEQKKATVETNKFNYGETIMIYDYNENVAINCGKAKEVFKHQQELYKAANKKLKFNKVLYILLDSGHVVELYVKLSQTHKVKKVNGKFGYDLENPLSDGLDPIMKGLQARYPFADLELGIGKYSIAPVTYTYPTFKQLGESDFPMELVQDIFDRINKVSLAKLISLTPEAGDTLPDSGEVQQGVVIEPDDEPTEALTQAQTITGSSDDLPF